MLNAEIVKREGQERFYDSGLTNYKQIASSKPFLFQQQIVQLSLQLCINFRQQHGLFYNQTWLTMYKIHNI